MAQEFDINIINSLIEILDDFETTASVIKPETVGDVLRQTYESLMPRDLRHMMGEYYTVDWLAEFTIEKSGYDNGLNTSVLDPTCGSGIFLTQLIRKYRNTYERELNYNELIGKITTNFVGFDINPIAVIQAKGNYILSLGDITQLDKAMSIPVYMCDSVLVPTVHAKQKPGDKSIVINTSVGEFVLPVLASREDSNTFLKLLSQCMLSDYTCYENFRERLSNEYSIVLDETTDSLARRLFSRLLALHSAGKDGFWPIILKNSYAPLFCEQQFDYIIGNPPWIAWKAMSENYRALTLDIWLSYGIFEKSAYDKITSHDDFAMAVTYVAIDHYLKEHGTAALILPQTFVKSLKGGEGFRKFSITRDGKSLPFSVTAVHDMLKVNPFKGIASNKTSVYIFRKSEAMTYPMKEYYEYELVAGRKIHHLTPWSRVSGILLSRRLSATPINDDPRSPWLTLPDVITSDIKHFLGKSPYAGRKGIEPCGAKGIYLVKITGRRPGQLKISNLIERSRLEEAKELGIHEGYVEEEHIYPLVGGRNISKWGLKDYIYMLVPHYSTGKAQYRGIPTEDMQTKYFLTYDWLFYFHDLLEATRIRSGKFFDIKQFPWYRLDNVGDYTFKPYKVLWQEQAKAVSCCVVSSITDDYVHDKTVVTDSKVLFVALDSAEEAHYLCAVLNSSTIEEIIQGYTINTNRGIDVVKNIRIPQFIPDDEIHVRLSSLSTRAHEAFSQKEFGAIHELNEEINTLVPLIFHQRE